ncbi:MAG: hypothetical protein D6689_20055 [Deltaproteobacteria bacterium]|nr:MAG: hypothetical protein D6689_20055 [Deltaproteobacteria bacterium]
MRLPGAAPATKLALATAEVVRARLQGALRRPRPPVPDAARPEDIPSVAIAGAHDRVLAEIDQDGFAFAVHPADEPYFNRRADRLRKRRYELHVVLHRGAVCVRKSFRRQDELASVATRAWGALGLLFFTEAAALLRLDDAGCAPRLRDVHVPSQTLYMDYIHGETLQRRFAAHTPGLTDLDGASDAIDDPDRERREHAAFAAHADEALRDAIAGLMRAMTDRGVAPMDIKLGNAIVGARTGAVYWIDFELAALRGAAGYARHLAEHRRRVATWFGVPA